MVLFSKVIGVDICAKEANNTFMAAAQEAMDA